MSRFIALILCIALGLSSAAQAEDTPDQSEPLWLDETMENMVTPHQTMASITTLKVMNQIRSVIRPTNLRSAIKLALLQHQGTVLSANKQSDHYAIKNTFKKWNY